MNANANEMKKGYPTKRTTLLTGHACCPTLAVTGYYLVEETPGSEIFMFSHEPRAHEIIAEHNRRWEAGERPE